MADAVEYVPTTEKIERLQSLVNLLRGEVAGLKARMEVVEARGPDASGPPSFGLPEGYRFVDRWYGRPGIVVAGRLRRREYVVVVQRLQTIWEQDESTNYAEKEWVDVGYYDELFPAKPPGIPE